MSNIIATSDFNGGTTNIPNLDLVGTNLQTNYIAVYEPVFLTELLGSDLYTELKAHIGDERFVALLPYIKPAIIDYVFFKYVEDNGGALLLGTGAGTSKKQNANTVSAWPIMVRVWNKMVDANKKTNKFLDGNIIYPEYVSVVLPSWFYIDGWYPSFDWNWYADSYGQDCLHEIYRYKNQFGI